ncbi:PAN2-PAN3 deadenylation complex catalytic subunit [Podosphaera aphanis]|nr:PAN2-PAN3 deadenylation complex catalytic subunit [Podosphaera aphanis]
MVVMGFDAVTNHRLYKMDGDWDEVGRLLLPPPGPQLPPTPVTTVTFDSLQELLWTANDYGRVSSHYGNELQQYSSFRAGYGTVHQILCHERGVITLTSTGVHMATRLGLPIANVYLFNHSDEEMIDVRCMSYTSGAMAEILVAGLQSQMFVINVEKGSISKRLHTEHHYSIMKRIKYIIAATENGVVHILDPKSFSVIKSWKAHASGINDMDSQHDFIVTCGYSMRHQQSLMLDPLVNCFDVKNMVALPPIPFPSGAAYVRMHPRMSTTCIIVSQHGQIHLVDLMNVNTSNIKQVNTLSYLTMFEIAPSGEAIALADTDCNIHLLGSPTRIRFAELSNPSEFPVLDETKAQLKWTVDCPLNSIGMPYYREPLLSAWPGYMIYEVGALPWQPDPEFLSTLNSADWGMYGRNPQTSLRYQAENTRKSEKTSKGIQAPKFLSEKREEIQDGTDVIAGNTEDCNESELVSVKAADVPVAYRTLDIKYSKYGVADFDFGYFNKTLFAGLETHIPNSYANSLLQILKYTPLLRNLALRHTATSCISDGCLLCELGFLFDMLEKAEGSACHATNFLKTLGQHPQAAVLGLIEGELTGTSSPSMLQRLSRFLFERIEHDWRISQPYSSAMDQALATGTKVSIRCLNCRSEHTRPDKTLVNSLAYPFNKSMLRNVKKPPNLTFSEVLKFSIEHENTSRGWCNRCNRYQNLASKKVIHKLPAVLMLDVGTVSSDVKYLWATPGWIPEEIGIFIDDGHLFCVEGDNLKINLERGLHKTTVYSLVGIAAEIASESGPNTQNCHLVSMINVAHSQLEASTKSRWHLFNDFLVRPVSSEEALNFSPPWKTASVITYQISVANNQIDNSWKKNLDTSLLYMDKNINPKKTYRSLVPNEDLPGPESVIALDTEFVSVRQPEIQVNADGEFETIRPTAYALARVSVLRGFGEKEGIPFIDDYVASKEVVVDYLTSFSGIVQGDLDPDISQHNLVPLKVAYKKLWILLNLGCRFLGHGLKQDFRVSNIFVPKAQVIDTSDFFYIPALKRKLSLAFLAWYVLKEDIQVKTHDSIEDARTALRLYHKYQEFEDAGVLDTILHDIYRKGKDTGFKPPILKGNLNRPTRNKTPPNSHEVLTPKTPSTPSQIRFPDLASPTGKSGSNTRLSKGWTPESTNGKAGP